MRKGRFGNYGGQYIPETLMNAVIELEEAYNRLSKDPKFIAELDDLLKTMQADLHLYISLKKITKSGRS